VRRTLGSEGKSLVEVLGGERKEGNLGRRERDKKRQGLSTSGTQEKLGGEIGHHVRGGQFILYDNTHQKFRK